MYSLQSCVTGLPARATRSVPSFFLKDEMPGTRTSPGRFWTALNESPKATFFLLLVFYLAVVCVQAATRLLWGDELITLAIAQTGSARGIWRALRLGADPNPPLSHLAVLFATRLLGISALAVRLPSIAAMLLAVACVWVLLRRWIAPGYAAVGVLAFMATRGFDYSYEARSYALLAGFTMAALVCWLRAADLALVGGRIQPLHSPNNLVRMVWLLGMALCLALAVSSNYYGVLAWFPVAAGEVALSFRARKFSPGTWLLLAVAALPLLAYLPLIRHNIAQFTPHAWNRPHISMVFESYLVLVEGVFWPVLFGALWLWRARSRVSNQESGAAAGNLLRTHEAVALSVLLAYPVLGFAVALGKAGMISPRCVLPVCCGFGLAAGLLAARLVSGSRTATLVIAAGIVWVITRESACAVLLYQQRAGLLELVQQIRSAPAGPIFICDSSLVFPLAQYGGPELRDRLVFPIDFVAIHASEPDDSGEQNLWAGRDGVFPFRIVSYSAAMARTPPALVIARPNGWLRQELSRDGMALTDVTTADQEKLIGKLGGVFTPMIHPETRLLVPRP